MARIVCVASGKGGVGKTTLCSNLAAGLSRLGRSVIAIDCNLTTSNLGLHLGVPMYPVTLQDVLKGNATVEDAIYYHSGGFRVVPADMSLSKSHSSTADRLLDVFYSLANGNRADVILIDSSAGLGRETKTAIEASDEMITITNPELPALVDALKLGKIADSLHTKNLGMVLNRVRHEPHEVKKEEAEKFLGLPLMGLVNEDRNVGRAISAKEPVVIRSPNSTAARQFNAIAAGLVGERYDAKVSLLHRLFNWL